MADRATPPTLGAVMKGIRARNGWTLKEMSEHTEIPLSTLSKIEHDRLTLTYDKLQHLAQQIAGAIMKTGGAIFLWSIVVFLFFKRFSAGFSAEQSYRKDPDSGIENILTFKDVTDAFGRVPPAQEPKSKI